MHIRFGMIVITGLASAAVAQPGTFSEGFEPPLPATTTGLPAGWTSVNVSPGGPGINPNWNWRNDGAVFPAHGGLGYAYANFNASTGANNISLYLISPLVNIANGASISFWTRTVDSPFFPDRLALEWNTTGTTNPADFTNTALTINPNLTTTGYPNTWTQFTYTFSGLGSGFTGRFAFHYNPTNGGPSGANSDYIGVDDLQFTAVPAPGSLALLAVGGLASLRRRR